MYWFYNFILKLLLIKYKQYDLNKRKYKKARTDQDRAKYDLRQLIILFSVAYIIP
nr:MAG TPA: hypothetical protein [Caudoviricetes sp.]